MGHMQLMLYFPAHQTQNVMASRGSPSPRSALRGDNPRREFSDLVPAKDEHAVEVKRIAVIGAGIMGGGIAHVSALGGYTTCLLDLDVAFLEKGLDTIRRNLQKGVERGKVSRDEMKAALGRLTFTLDLEEAASGADLVIEAVVEDMAAKLDLFGQLDRITPDHAILASNTSALSVTEMGGATNRPDRVLGMHFFNPPHIMRLVEIIRGLESSEESIGTAEEVSRGMGKETVVVNESPGFITSRVNALVGNEAFRMLQEGVASAEDIDTAVRLGLNHPMGPLEMADMVGLDTRLHILEHLQKILGDRYRPTPIHLKHVAAGRLGRKTGRGVYTYDEQGRRK